RLLLRRIDGAIQVRSHVDLTFYSLVGSGRSGGGHHGSSLLEASADRLAPFIFSARALDQ
ncbi:hypothetical protein ZWY2020_039004, partial [Hordeum vulgare]